MTDINVDELIAEARSLSTYEGSTLERAADALEHERQENERLRSTLVRILGYVRGAVRREIPSFEDEYGAEHDASLIESLADDFLGVPHPNAGRVTGWLREKARERREGVS